MKKSYQFGEGPIFTITNYIMWFFLGNLYFFLCNFPLVFMFLVQPQTDTIPQEYWVLLVISLIPVGPAFTALLSAMGKLVRENDVNITKDFFSAYKKNFRQSLFLWLIEMVVVGILIVDIRFFTTVSYGIYIKPLFLGFLLIVIAVGFYIFPILSRFYMKSMDVIKISFMYTILKFKITFLIMITIVACYFILPKMSVLMLFAMSGICYLIMFYQKGNLKELEEKININEDKKIEPNE